MKQSINLVPSQEATSDHWLIQVLVLPAGALMVLIVLVGGTVLKAREVSGLRLDVQEMDQNRAALNRSVTEMAGRYPLGDENPALQSRSSTENPILWSNILKEISRRLPPSVWLTRIESFPLTGKKEAGEAPVTEIKISGIAQDHRDVDQLLFALENPSAWKGIRLVFSKKVWEGEKEKIEFLITVRLV